ncbi:MAG TPA: leucyl aminopeptidase [Thermoanaerobaculia bacterium]|nr:leucyl aminopeptidase [Thermoanaerobaculia bacterium]
MHVTISREPKFQKIDHLFVLVAEKSRDVEAPPAIREAVETMISLSGFSGRADETISTVSTTPRKLTLIGIGKGGDFSIRVLRGALYQAARIARKHRDHRIAVVAPYTVSGSDAEGTTKLAATMLAQSDYKYDAYLTVRKEDRVPAIEATLIPPESLDRKTARAIEEEARTIAEGVGTVRDLGNAPSNLITPERLAERAEEVARAVGVKATVYGRREIVRMKMGGLLAVNRGSAEEPRFIVLEYVPRRARKHVALVGKGVTFDSGGISIKPAEKMEEMKFDMCGAAAVIGIVEAAARLELPVKITGVIPSTENLPSGSAYKPGDIITMMNGKTVEIVNTDAEGRMILGDALHYASKLEPDHLIDFATLTGACVVALGSEATGLFSTDDELARKLIECGERVGDRLWRLPVWDEYKDLIRSEWADMKNSGGRWGGAISAAVFLKEFVDCPSWAHLDIAGTAYAERETPREVRGATAAGVPVTVEFLQSLAR